MMYKLHFEPDKYMKQPFIVLFLLFSLMEAASQNSFSTVYGGADYDRPTCIKQIESSFYLATFEFKEEYLPGHKAEIIKLNGSGDIVKKICLYSPGSQYCPISKIFPISNSEFLLLGGIRESEDSNTSIWIIKMDTSLNIIWENKIQTEEKYLERINCTRNNSGNIALCVTLCSGNPFYQMPILFLELNLAGELLRSRYDTTGSPYTTMGYSIICNNSGYYAFVMGFSSYMPVPMTSFAQRLDLDTNFNITRVRTLPNSINQDMTAVKINEGSYYLTGSVYYTGLYHEIEIQKADTSNTVLATNHSGTQGDIPDYPAWLKCMTLKDTNNIYTGGTGWAGGGLTECNLLHPKVFILSNYDSLLNCRWTRYYGSDTACYYMMDLDATEDGGCIMAGTILAPSTGPNQTDVILIKVDSLGLITSTNKPGTRAMEAMVYPNPGNEYLILQTGPQNLGASFTFMNLTGQKLDDYIVNSTTQQIPTSTLPPGTYTWTISRGNSLIESGKWIKQ